MSDSSPETDRAVEPPIVFSVIIPTYDRPQRLRACLQALAAMDYPRTRFEVCVVDDGGRTAAGDVAAEFCRQLSVRTFVQPHAGPAVARNHGAAHARGRFLAFIDDDCAPAANWLTVLENSFQASPTALLGGRTVNGLPDNAYSSASQLIIDYLYAHYNVTADRATFFATNNLAVPAADFASVGGFDTSFPLPAAEDRDFCDRWRRHGRVLRYAPAAVVYHQHALRLRSFARQHFHYGRGAAHFHAMRAARTYTSILHTEPPSFYLKLVSYPFSRRPFVRALSLSALLLVSQLSTAVGFAYELIARRQDRRAPR